MKDLEQIISKSHADFLKARKINVGDKKLFDKNDCYFNVVKFYNFSDSDALIQLNADYEGRFDAGLFIIADAGNGDYVLMDQKGNIFFWNHEINDLGYDPEAEKPVMIAKNIDEFLKALVKESDFDIEPEVKSIKLSDDFNDLFKDFLK